MLLGPIKYTLPTTEQQYITVYERIIIQHVTNCTIIQVDGDNHGVNIQFNVLIYFADS